MLPASGAIEYGGRAGETMLVLRLQRLLPCEAEKAICRIWRVLEAHSIATPKVKATGQDRLTIELTFDSTADPTSVAAALQHVGVERVAAG